MAITQKNKQCLEKVRKEQIQNAAFRLFWEKGFGNTTIEEIAKEVGISKGLIYHYYSSKAELLFSFEEKYRECISEIYNLPTALDMIREAGRRFLCTDPDESGYVPSLQVLVVAFAKGEIDSDYKKDRNPLYQDPGKTLFAPLFQKAMDDGQIKQNDALLLGEIYWHFLLGNIVDLMHKNVRENRFDVIDGLIEILKA